MTWKRVEKCFYGLRLFGSFRMAGVADCGKDTAVFEEWDGGVKGFQGMLCFRCQAVICSG